MRTRFAAVIGVVAVWSGSCSGSSVTTVETTTTVEATTTTSADPGIRTTSDVRFAAAAPTSTAWSEPLLDVYSPSSGADLPLVVLLPAHSMTKTGLAAYPKLATALATRGAVVVVANWTQTEDLPDVTGTLQTIDDGGAVVACALSFAVEHASEYGANPERLVVAGHFYGGNAAMVAAFSPATPQPGCLASTPVPAVRGVFTWDADAMTAMDLWDAFGPDAARVTAALTPWGTTGVLAPIDVRLAVSDVVDATNARCDAANPPEWLSQRDPDGSMRSALETLGAFSDGCLTPSETAEATAAHLSARGADATVVRLSGPDTTMTSLGATDVDLLTTTVFELAGT